MTRKAAVLNAKDAVERPTCNPFKTEKSPVLKEFIVHTNLFCTDRGTVLFFTSFPETALYTKSALSSLNKPVD